MIRGTRKLPFFKFKPRPDVESASHSIEGEGSDGTRDAVESHGVEREPPKPATDENEPSSGAGKPLVEEEQQPGLISQLVAASKSNKTKRVHRSGSVSSNEQILEDVGTPQLLEEPDTTQWGLKVIKRQPPRETDAVDIIAIHGLGGNWDTTWTDPETGVNWLKSLLVEDIPKARIMSYGYNSKEYFSKSNANIQDFALDLLVDYKSYRTSVAEKSRPVIFLCHSLGGIVFKQALIQAHEDPEYSNILGHIFGVIFFATPHRGSSLAKWNSIGTNIVRAVSLNTSTNVISKDLKLQSNLLSNIAGSWIHRANNIKIVSCYEMMSTYGTTVVEQDSALLKWGNEKPVPMNSNHLDICRFSKRGEPDYLKVITRLKEMVEESIKKFKTSGQTLSEAESRCLSCLETSDYESHLTEIVRNVQGTCRWIFENERYCDWNGAKSGRLLWVSADAGCGKSVLAKYLIVLLKKHNPGSNVCFFVFKNGSAEQEDAVHALSAILHQICSFQPELLEHAIIKQKHFARGANLKKPFEALWDVFLDCIHDKRLKDTLCVIDALDECERSTRALLVEQLALLFGTDNLKSFPFKIIVTSRPDNTIKKSFGTLSNIRLRGEDEIVSLNKDIRLFVQERVDQIAAQSDIPSDLLNDLQKALINGADFTFLWTSLVIKLLEEGSRDGVSRTDLEGILRSRSLDDIYEHLLSNSTFPLKAKKMLYLVITAERPLTLDELRIAVEVHRDYVRRFRRALPPGRQLDAQKAKDFKRMEEASPSHSRRRATTLDLLKDRLKYPFSNHIRLLCGHFLRIRGNKVYLVHQTARQFLLRERSKEDFSVGYSLREFGWNISCPTGREIRYIEQHGIPDYIEGEKEDLRTQQLLIWRQSIRRDVANRYMLQVCVDYLELVGGQSDIQLPHQTSAPAIHDNSANEKDALEWYYEIKDHPCGAFLDYAARYWVAHYQDVRVDVDDYFDYLCKPRQRIFHLWIQQHPSFIDAHQDKWPGEASSIRHCSIPDQHVLDHFDLDKEDNELWDHDDLDGPHYWEQNSQDSQSASEEDEYEFGRTTHRHSRPPRVSKVPDRIRAFRNQHRETIARNEEFASNPGRISNSVLSKGNSLRFSSISSDFTKREKVSLAASVQKGFKLSRV